MRYLLIGDLHTQISNLEDTARLFRYARELINTEKIDSTILLGDLYHTHSVIRQEVVDFYRKNIKDLKGLAQFKPTVICGNHDLVAPSRSDINAITLTLSDLVNVVDKPKEIDLDSYGIPYIHDNNKFIEAVQGSTKDLIFCHQTVQGAQYENGFYAPDGVDLAKLPEGITIISGHIHTASIISYNTKKFIYTGTPRSLTAAEVNQPKGFQIYNEGILTFLPTNHLVKEFRSFLIQEGTELTELDESLWKPGDDVRVQVTGSELFYRSIIEKYSMLVGKVKFIPNIKRDFSKKVSIEAEDHNIDKALFKYVNEVADIPVELKDKVWTKIQEQARRTQNVSN